MNVGLKSTIVPFGLDPFAFLPVRGSNLHCFLINVLICSWQLSISACPFYTSAVVDLSPKKDYINNKDSMEQK